MEAYFYSEMKAEIYWGDGRNLLGDVSPSPWICIPAINDSFGIIVKRTIKETRGLTVGIPTTHTVQIDLRVVLWT